LIVDGKKISSVPRPAGADLEKSVGQWNRVEIICDRDQFFFSINSRRVVSGMSPVPRSGSIMFRHNRGDIQFGRVQIVEYDALGREDAQQARLWQRKADRGFMGQNQYASCGRLRQKKNPLRPISTMFAA